MYFSRGHFEAICFSIFRTEKNGSAKSRSAFLIFLLHYKTFVIAEIPTFMTPASTMTQMGFSFVFRSSNTQIPKITTMLHSVPVMEIVPPLPQNAFFRIRIPADAIMATTAGRRDFNTPCNRSDYDTSGIVLPGSSQ